MPVQAEKTYEVPSQVAVRWEKFGGLVYRYDNRALLFLHSRPLVEFIESLDGKRTLGEVMGAFAAEKGISEAQCKVIENALGQLETKGIIRELRPAA
ncbi:mycofactocin biosynthesis chaperone MftB [Rubrobacter indicoceani]|uniref:mycofactocin biosynthesis chaperone MftB n=1 Tax=Rubrobacter indicoceani TaxID=2051957 RepID=UPI000E5B3BCA|nr:mycofactocin biosynthesis chaperone MftB [Rubrobacter indicoceani]